MGLSDSGKSKVVSVDTDHLRQRLNRLYDATRSGSRQQAAFGRFDYLWDLKELAMLEGRRSVEIPDSWLDELERTYVALSEGAGRAH